MELVALRRRIAGAVVENGAPDYPTVRDAMVWNRLKPIPQRRSRFLVRRQGMHGHRDCLREPLFTLHDCMKLTADRGRSFSR